MRLKFLTLAGAILCGLAAIAGRAAEFQSAEPGAGLVVVVNRAPANPAGGDLWLADLRGRLVQRLTNNNAHEEHPKFSPDGRRIAFARNLGGLIPGGRIDPRYNEIFVLDLRTGEERRLTRNEVEDGHPEWSYDGKQIAFHSRRSHPEGGATVWVMGADGSLPRRVTTLSPGDLSHTDPVWSPDGQWLIFVNHRDEAGVRVSRIEKVRADDSQRVVVSSGGRSGAVAGGGRGGPAGDLDPAPSPDGAMIWSARRLESGTTVLFSFGAGVYYGGKAERQMQGSSPRDVVERHPNFSPDGMRVVFSRSSLKAGPRTRQIVITDNQGALRRFVTSREDWDLWDPSWHPFAGSGTEREVASRVVTYAPRGDQGATLPAGDWLETSDKMQFASARTEPGSATAAPPPGSTAVWQLDVPPERILSLALRYEGKLVSEAERDGIVTFQLMDWEERKWVSVFSRGEGSEGEIKIDHEMSPANFVHPETRQVRLRLVVARLLAGPPPDLITERLTLDVRQE